MLLLGGMIIEPCYTIDLLLREMYKGKQQSTFNAHNAMHFVLYLDINY